MKMWWITSQKAERQNHHLKKMEPTWTNKLSNKQRYWIFGVCFKTISNATPPENNGWKPKIGSLGRCVSFSKEAFHRFHVNFRGLGICYHDLGAMVKSRYIGDGHPTFNRNPYNGYIYKPLLLGWWPSPIIWNYWEFRPQHIWNRRNVAIQWPGSRIVWTKCFGRVETEFSEPNRSNISLYKKESTLSLKLTAKAPKNRWLE